MKSIYIVEDENSSRDIIISAIKTNFLDVEIKTASSLASARDLFSVQKPDLAILDIEYPDGNAFQLLHEIYDKNFQIIFISGYEKYAIQAFKFSAIDYLLKPFISEELITAIRQGIDSCHTAENNKKLIETLLSNYSQPVHAERQIVLRTFDEINIVNTSNILHCASDNNYTTFHFDNHSPIMVSKPIKEYEDLLADYHFMRVHQSYLVNLKRIKKFDKRDGGFLVMADNTQIPVATRKKPQLMDYFSSLG